MATRITNKCLNEFKESGKIDEATAKAIMKKAYKISNNKRKGKYRVDNVNDPEILREAADAILAEKKYDDYVKALEFSILR